MDALQKEGSEWSRKQYDTMKKLVSAIAIDTLMVSLNFMYIVFKYLKYSLNHIYRFIIMIKFLTSQSRDNNFIMGGKSPRGASDLLLQLLRVTN